MDARKLIWASATLVFANLFMNSCADNPSAVSLEDYGIVPSIRIADGSRYLAGNEVELHVDGAGADSCAIWNVTVDGDGGRQHVELDRDQPTVLSWQLAEGEGRRLVRARFWGRGGIVSQPIEASVVVDNTAPEVGAAIFPAPGSGPVGTTVRFAWSPFVDAIEDSADIRYRLDVGGPAWGRHVDCGASTEWVVAGIPEGASISWSVTATDAAGNSTLADYPDFETWNIRLPAFVEIPPGMFSMGSPGGEVGRYDDETLHGVELTRGFRLGATQITYEAVVPLLQWAYDHAKVTADADFVRDAVGADGAILWRFAVSAVQFDGSEFHYVVAGNTSAVCDGLTWYGAAALCDWLNAAGGLDPVFDRADGWRAAGDPYGVVGYRLPTEAEWEYACRAGTATAFWNGDLYEPCPCSGDPFCCCVSPVLEQVGWYCANSRNYDGTPGMKTPNPWGIFDMHGGYGDWCYDTGDGSYPDGPAIDPSHYGDPGTHVTRGAVGGGPLIALPRDCRSAARGGGLSTASHYSGARLVLSGLGSSGR